MNEQQKIIADIILACLKSRDDWYAGENEERYTEEWKLSFDGVIFLHELAIKIDNAVRRELSVTDQKTIARLDILIEGLAPMTNDNVALTKAFRQASLALVIVLQQMRDEIAHKG